MQAAEDEEAEPQGNQAQAKDEGGVEEAVASSVQLAREAPPQAAVINPHRF